MLSNCHNSEMRSFSTAYKPNLIIPAFLFDHLAKMPYYKQELFNSSM